MFLISHAGPCVLMEKHILVIYCARNFGCMFGYNLLSATTISWKKATIFSLIPGPTYEGYDPYSREGGGEEYPPYPYHPADPSYPPSNPPPHHYPDSQGESLGVLMRNVVWSLNLLYAEERVIQWGLGWFIFHRLNICCTSLTAQWWTIRLKTAVINFRLRLKNDNLC